MIEQYVPVLLSFEPVGDFSINIKYTAVSIGWDGTLFIENFVVLDALDYAGNLRWRFPFGKVLNAFASECTPVVDKDGISYLGMGGVPSDGKNLIALDKEGNLKFAAQLKQPDRFGLPHIDSFPAIGDDGVLYVGSDGDTHLFAVK